MKTVVFFCVVILVAAVLVTGQSRTPTGAGSAAAPFKVTETSLAELKSAPAGSATPTSATQSPSGGAAKAGSP